MSKLEHRAVSQIQKLRHSKRECSAAERVNWNPAVPAQSGVPNRLLRCAALRVWNDENKSVIHYN